MLNEEQTNRGTLEETSETTEPVSEVEKTTDSDDEVTKWAPPTFATEDEYNTFIASKATPLAQGMKDKELKGIYEERDALKSRVARMEREASYKAEDTKLGRLEAAELTDWGNTSEVQDIHDVRREVIKQGRELSTRTAENEATAKELQEVGLKQNAFEAGLKLFLPEDAEFLAEINAFVEKLQKAATQNEMDLLVSMEESRLKAKVEAGGKKTKRPAPDGAVGTASGGIDQSKLKGVSAVEHGLKQLNKQGG
jgi:hypothetical protein